MNPDAQEATAAADAPIILPVPSLVLLIGPSGSGKSTFAASRFGPYEVVSSDHCRAMVADSEADQSVTPAAFELLRCIARLRLAAARLSVVDATNVHAMARQRNLELAAECRVPTIAVVFDVSLERCLTNNARRRVRVVDQEVIVQQRRDLIDALPTLHSEGYASVYRLDDLSVDTTAVVRVPWIH